MRFARENDLIWNWFCRKLGNAPILIPTREEEPFWKVFSEESYHPDWIFGDSNELENIAKHPMVLWKCENKTENTMSLDKRKVRLL